MQVVMRRRRIPASIRLFVSCLSCLVCCCWFMSLLCFLSFLQFVFFFVGFSSLFVRSLLDLSLVTQE
jgi:hypothetical protein